MSVAKSIYGQQLGFDKNTTWCSEWSCADKR